MKLVMLGTALILATGVGPAVAQNPNPSTTAAPPWPIDQRCAPIAGHTAAAHRAYLNCAALDEARKLTIDTPSELRRGAQHLGTQGSRPRAPQTDTPPNRE